MVVVDGVLLGPGTGLPGTQQVPGGTRVPWMGDSTMRYRYIYIDMGLRYVLRIIYYEC